VNGWPFVHLLIHVSQWDVSCYDPANSTTTTHCHENHSSQYTDTEFLYLQETCMFFQQCICWNLWINQKAAISVLNKHYRQTLKQWNVCVQIMMWTDNCVKNGIIVICMVILHTSQVSFFISLKCTSAFWNCNFNKSFPVSLPTFLALKNFISINCNNSLGK
jgi:hypothetical protein